MISYSLFHRKNKLGWRIWRITKHQNCLTQEVNRNISFHSHFFKSFKSSFSNFRISHIQTSWSLKQKTSNLPIFKRIDPNPKECSASQELMTLITNGFKSSSKSKIRNYFGQSQYNCWTCFEEYNQHEFRLNRRSFLPIKALCLQSVSYTHLTLPTILLV